MSRSIRQGPPFDALDMVAGNIDLENDASMVYKLLENNGGSELDQSLGVEDEGHLVRFRGAIGDQGFRDGWERDEFQQIIGIIQQLGIAIVDDYLSGDAKRNRKGRGG